MAINLAGIFADYHDLNGSWNFKKRDEHFWALPREIGNGYMSVQKINSRLTLGLGDFRATEKIVDDFEQPMPEIVIGFSVASRRRYRLLLRQQNIDEQTIQSGCGFIYYKMDRRGKLEYPEKIPIRFVGIYIGPKVLKNFAGDHIALYPDPLREILKGNRRESFHQSFMLTPAINMALGQIFNCPDARPLKRAYLESKVLELTTHAMAQLVLPKNTPCDNRPVQTDGIRYVWAAKDMLLDNLADPPSLHELARRVGSNKTTLNQGFRQVFGTSAFEFLRIQRLERARELLENKRMNVTQTALEVGYEHPKNFTRAFKSHFGINPKEFLE